MMISHLLKQRFIPILFTLLMTLQLAACGSSDDSADTGGHTKANISLSWVAPAEREDGSALPTDQIAEYKIYYRVTQTQDKGSVTVTDCTAVCSIAIDLPAGSYYLSVTTIDTDRRESQPSDEIAVSVS